MATVLPKASARRALVVGLGRTGVSVARHLAARGWSVAVTDSRQEPPGLAALREVAPDAAVFVGGFSERALDHTDQVILSPPEDPRRRVLEALIGELIGLAGAIQRAGTAAGAHVVIGGG